MIKVGKKYGCLTALDLGTEYQTSVTFSESKKELENLLSKIKELEEKKKSGNTSGEDFWDWVIYKDRIEKLKILISPHFKCKCKCGKTHYYNEETLLSLPKYCIYPVPISTKHTYSTKANNARYNKVRKFEILENGIICNKDDCLPSEKILCRVEQV